MTLAAQTSLGMHVNAGGCASEPLNMPGECASPCARERVPVGLRCVEMPSSTGTVQIALGCVSKKHKGQQLESGDSLMRIPSLPLYFMSLNLSKKKRKQPCLSVSTTNVSVILCVFQVVTVMKMPGVC